MSYLKGDTFINRYRLTGELTAISPIHIGSGEAIPDESILNEKKEPVEVSLITTDYNKKPYIPGSALRGVMRHYLRHIFVGLGNNKLAQDQDFEADKFKNVEQGKQIEYMRTEASMLELLFGTPFAEGKIEIWDSTLLNPIMNNQFTKEQGWNPERQTFTVKSVAIDPVTGTALPHKLYTFEVTPPGFKYELNIVGQNLSNEEIGMLLFGLDAFNSDIFPLTIGAMAGRGFGRMKFSLKKIYQLTLKELPAWITNANNNGHAGYESLPEVTNKKAEFIQQFKAAFLQKVGR